MARVIDKIKYADARVDLAYTETSTNSVNTYTIDSADQPMKTFNEALQALKSFVLDLLELPDSYGEKNFAIKGVSFTHKSDIMGAVVTAEKKLADSNSPFNIATPHLPSKPYNPKDTDSLHLSPTFVRALDRLIDEANKYIDGKRLQMDIGKN